MMLVRLFRDSFNTPWGFRLQGGKDLNQELVVQRVFSNSPAERELQRGDVILSINGRDASSLTHKQALEGIKHGGGQIELCVRRPPPGRSEIKPLQPTSPTRAPPLFTPVKTPSVLLPVRRSSDHSPKNMPAPHSIAGHQPKKVTMNKFGGGTTHFGTNFGARAMQPGWVPQPSPYSQQYTPQSSMSDQVDSGPAMHYAQQAPQQHYQPAPQSPQYQPAPQSPQYQMYATNQPTKYQEQPQYRQAPPPQPQIQQYTSPGLSQPDYVRSEDPVEEEEYEYVPVTQRKKAFAGQPKKEPAIVKAGKKKVFKPSGYTPFGTDYSQPQAPKPFQQPQRPQAPPPPVERPVNAAPAPHDEPDTSSSSVAWSSTLRSSGGPRPWEHESKEYVMPSQREVTKQTPRKQPPPTVSPKPSRSPHQAQQKESPQPQITIRSVPNEPLQDAAQDGARVVHLQYNSPMGLYSNENVQQTYAGQIQGSDKTSSTVSKPAQQAAPGDRDWNQSHVYRMIKETTTKDTQIYPPKKQNVQSQPVTSHTYQSTQKTYTYTPTIEDGYGISDF